MNAIEKEVREMLKAAGAKLARRAGKGGEVYRLPNGMTFVCSDGSGQRRGNQNQWQKSLSQLRRIVGKIDPDNLAGQREAQETIDRAIVNQRFVGERAAHEPKMMKALAVVTAEAAGGRDAALAEIKKQNEFKVRGGCYCVECGKRLGDDQASAKPCDCEAKQPTKNEEQQVKVIPMKQEMKNEPTVDTSTRGKGWKKRWTQAQDKMVIEGYDARMAPHEIAQLMQDIRPGVLAVQIINRASSLRSRLKSLGAGYSIPVQAAAPLTPAASPAPAPAPAPAVATTRPALARVTFEIGGRVRVVEVDEATARDMYAKAMTL